MSKEELLKYLIAEIDLIMHDKDYRFENEDGTWYSRESCRDLTNEEVFEELRNELRQLANLEAEKKRERFIFPTYDEFSTNKDSKFCFYKNGYKYVLHNALPMFESIRINKLIENENIIIFEQPLTKMNYIKACEYAQKLFLEKEN